MTGTVNGDPFKEEEPMTAAPMLDRTDWTVDKVSKLPEDLHYELIDGRLVLTPAAMPIHQSIGIDIALALRANRPDDVIVTTDQSVQIDFRNEPRPDVVAIRKEGASRTPVYSADVRLAVEIISPSSKSSDRKDKLKLYAYGGIPHYWIIDPLAERISVTQYVLGLGGSYHYELQVDKLWTMDQPWETTLDLPAWTRERDELRELARPDFE